MEIIKNQIFKDVQNLMRQLQEVQQELAMRAADSAAEAEKQMVQQLKAVKELAEQVEQQLIQNYEKKLEDMKRSHEEQMKDQIELHNKEINDYKNKFSEMKDKHVKEIEELSNRYEKEDVIEVKDEKNELKDGVKGLRERNEKIHQDMKSKRRRGDETNLRIVWAVLTQAWQILAIFGVLLLSLLLKILTKIFAGRRGDITRSKEALKAILLALGEMSIENCSQDAEDLNACLEKCEDKLPKEMREIAETQYQPGVALSYHCQFDEAVQYLNDAKKVSSSLLDNLKPDTFNVRVGKVYELELLLPEVALTNIRGAVKFKPNIGFKAALTYRRGTQITSMSSNETKDGQGRAKLADQAGPVPDHESGDLVSDVGLLVPAVSVKPRAGIGWYKASAATYTPSKFFKGATLAANDEEGHLAVKHFSVEEMLLAARCYSALGLVELGEDILTNVDSALGRGVLGLCSGPKNRFWILPSTYDRGWPRPHGVTGRALKSTGRNTSR